MYSYVIMAQLVPNEYNFFRITPEGITQEPFMKLTNVNSSADDIQNEISRLLEQAELYVGHRNNLPPPQRRPIDPILRKIGRLLNRMEQERDRKIQEEKEARNMMNLTNTQSYGAIIENDLVPMIKDYLGKKRVGNGMKLQESKHDFKLSPNGYGVEIEELFTRITKKNLLHIIKQIDGNAPIKKLNTMKKQYIANFLMDNYATKESGDLSHPPISVDNRPAKKVKTLKQRKEDPNPRHVAHLMGTSLDKGKRPKPSVKKGGFLQALALPVAEYFLDNPNSNLNPFNPMNTTAQDFSKGNFKPKKTGLAGMFGR